MGIYWINFFSLYNPLDNELIVPVKLLAYHLFPHAYVLPLFIVRKNVLSIFLSVSLCHKLSKSQCCVTSISLSDTNLCQIFSEFRLYLLLTKSGACALNHQSTFFVRWRYVSDEMETDYNSNPPTQNTPTPKKNTEKKKKQL